MVLSKKLTTVYELFPRYARGDISPHGPCSHVRKPQPTSQTENQTSMCVTLVTERPSLPPGWAAPDFRSRVSGTTPPTSVTSAGWSCASLTEASTSGTWRRRATLSSSTLKTFLTAQQTKPSMSSCSVGSGNTQRQADLSFTQCCVVVVRTQRSWRPFSRELFS